MLPRLEDYPDENWCPDCGEPRGICRCEFEAYAEDYDGDGMFELICPHCNGTGLDYILIVVAEVVHIVSRDLLDKV